MWPRNVQPSPVVARVVTGKWPSCNGPPFRLAVAPPGNPLVVELPDVGDQGDGVALVSPVNDFLGTGL